MIARKYPFYTIGVDVGGTKISAAVLFYQNENKPPEIIEKDSIKSQASLGADKLVKNICLLIKTLINRLDNNCNKQDCNLIAVGIGSAGRINKHTGTIMTATNNFPGYQGCELSDIVAKSIGIPTFILNDVQSHTYGEARWGAGKDVSNFILLAIGTGIGGAVVINGNLMFGYHGYAGELGHIASNYAKDVLCACGKYGHLEAIASGTGIEQSYYRFSGKHLTGPEISKLANSGDNNAIKSISLAGESLGCAIATYLSIFDPELIILSGSVSKSGKIWEDALYCGFKKEAVEDLHDNLNLKYAKLGDNAAFIGAAEYAIDRL